MIIYIAGKYSGTPEEIEENICAARRAAIEVWEAGYVAICPHLNTAHFEQDCKCSYEQYLIGDLQILARCDAAMFLPGWEESSGARQEHDYCLRNGISICYYKRGMKCLK